MSAPNDTELNALLAEVGADLSLSEVKAIAAGIAAAPPRHDTGLALDLIAPERSVELQAALEALIEDSRTKAPVVPSDAKERGDRLQRLRDELQRRDLDGLLVPMADEYQNEFVPERALRIAWLSGFTGSAGLIVVLADKAAIFTDGRYTLQVSDQVDTGLFECRHITEAPPDAWISGNLSTGARLAYDPWLFTADQVARFHRAADKAGGVLVAVDDNPVDAVWETQPPRPLAPVVPHDLDFAGEPSADKRHRIAAELAEAGADASVITAPDSIAWLLNIRGGDVPRTPLPLSSVVLRVDGQVDLFVDRRKLSPGLETHLGNEVRVREETEFEQGLDDLSGKTVQVDPAGTAAWVFECLKNADASVVKTADPCQLPKACKNAVELEGARQAHIRDGAAVAKFLHWLEAEVPAGKVDELGALDRLAAYRRKNERFQDLSFDTISGAGPNGAIVHYRVNETTNRKIRPGELFLIDSGAQYLDGTTDITRTVAIGKPTQEMRERFTLVLQGHIAIATARFPKGTRGIDLDPLARRALWTHGLDYDHGTGHGIGSYLSVHEGPQSISRAGLAALEPGMICSNEPGYYKEGAYGIRIENLVLLTKPQVVPGGDREMMGFETLTLAPIDHRLIVRDMLSAAETAWLDAYHARVLEAVGPEVDAETRVWLQTATAPL